MKIGIVLPRYVAHTAITAGAERLGAALAQQLAGRDHCVEVLTTCALNLANPQNDIPEGISGDGAVRVRHFALDLANWNAARYQTLTRLWSQGALRSESDEQAWLDSLPHSPKLYGYLDQHARDYDALLFLPYITPTTLYGAVLCADQAVLMPALHDEPFARMRIVRQLLSSARRVLFLSDAEHDLAVRGLRILLRDGRVVGAGVADRSNGVSSERFRSKYHLTGPVVLYAGRIEPAKNIHCMLAYIDDFRHSYSKHTHATFVLRGTLGMYIRSRPNVRVLPPDPTEGYWDAYAAADVLCQPSQMESFSITLMEGWLCGIPALVHAQCTVTKGHVQQSNGGLWFGNSAEFSAGLDWLLSNPHLCAAMGQNGRRYAQDHYSWDVVLPRIEQALQP